MARPIKVAVLGAGVSGICAGVYLKRFTNHDFVIFEKAADVGGTWRDNIYPGVECDVPSHLYSYSFRLNPDWTHEFPSGAEIHAYLRDVMVEFGLAPHLRLNTPIVSAAYSEEGWRLTTDKGEEQVFDAVICGLGGLHVPKYPQGIGLENFTGPSFHTARWRHEVDLAGKRVGMIGTGASAVQCAPKVAEIAQSLHIFQRTPIWVGPKRNPEIDPEEREELRRDFAVLRKKRWELWRGWETNGLEMVTPGSAVNQKAQRRAHQHLLNQVQDANLAQALTPDYNFTCKRPTISETYYAMFNRDNVELVTDGVRRIGADAVITEEGRRIELDVLILATGFQSFDITHEIDIVGVDGVSLRDAWKERITSYRTVMVPRMPNLFILLGPNSAGLTSTYQMIEAECGFVLKALDYLRERGGRWLSPRPAEAERFCNEVQRQFAGTTQNKGCVSWWTDGAGYAHANWPSSSVEYRLMLQQFVPSHFDIR